MLFNKLSCAVAIVAQLFIWAPVAAVSLGKPEIKSTMGQPFEAIIPINARADEVGGLVVRLAAGGDYTRLGVDYKYFLRNLQGEMLVDKNLKPIGFRLFSRTPMFQPEIRVILEAVWPEGRFLRSYVLLVQPSENVHDVARLANRAGGDAQFGNSGAMPGEVFVIREGDPASPATPLLDQYWNNPAPVYNAPKSNKKGVKKPASPPQTNGQSAVILEGGAASSSNDDGAKAKELAEINARIGELKKQLSEPTSKTP